MLRHVGLLGMSAGKHVDTHISATYEILFALSNSKIDNFKKEGSIIEESVRINFC